MERLLLHICCGPCGTSVIERLSDTYSIHGFFFNPNIQPEEEYYRRLDSTRDVASYFSIPMEIPGYDTDRFEEAVRGYEQEPENGARCSLCYRLRLEETARYARENGYGIFASTLTLGPQKRASVINPIGHEIAGKYSLRFLDGDWKKQDGFKRSLELSRTLKIYRQKYCGCLLSIRDLA